ncbi:MAG: hypothetical protein WDW38_004745 [Sanguina aurantia]
MNPFWWLVTSPRKSGGTASPSDVQSNKSGDHLVGWANSSIRFLHQLPALPAQTARARGVVLEEPFSAAWDLGSSRRAGPDEPTSVEDVPIERPGDASAASSRESAEQASEMLRRLQSLPWRRIDVSFKGARFGFAHNNIQVTRSSPRAGPARFRLSARQPPARQLIPTLCLTRHQQRLQQQQPHPISAPPTHAPPITIIQALPLCPLSNTPPQPPSQRASPTPTPPHSPHSSPPCKMTRNSLERRSNGSSADPARHPSGLKRHSSARTNEISPAVEASLLAEAEATRAAVAAVAEESRRKSEALTSHRLDPSGSPEQGPAAPAGAPQAQSAAELASVLTLSLRQGAFVLAGQQIAAFFEAAWLQRQQNHQQQQPVTPPTQQSPATHLPASQAASPAQTDRRSGTSSDGGRHLDGDACPTADTAAAAGACASPRLAARTDDVKSK